MNARIISRVHESRIQAMYYAYAMKDSGTCPMIGDDEVNAFAESFACYRQELEHGDSHHMPSVQDAWRDFMSDKADASTPNQLLVTLKDGQQVAVFGFDGKTARVLTRNGPRDGWSPPLDRVTPGTHGTAHVAGTYHVGEW